MSKYYTAINCIDGRVQIPVIEYLKERFGVAYVDIVSEAGPNRIIADGINEAALDSLERRLRISLVKHESVGIAIVGHHDCAGNPATAEEQREDTLAAVGYIHDRFGHVPVIGLWVDENWEVSEVSG